MPLMQARKQAISQDKRSHKNGQGCQKNQRWDQNGNHLSLADQ
jgi:hypothetical protein